jgi:RNA recognition motif-containing protein
MNIYIGNLSHDTTEEELQEVFSSYGHVDSAKVIKDKFSGESKGFGFIEMPNNSEADSAIQDLNGKELKGNVIKVSQARPRPEKRRGGGRRY